MCNDFLWSVDILDQLADLQSAYQNLSESPLTNQPIERTGSRLLIRRGGAVNARRADNHLHSKPGGKPRWASQILMGFSRRVEEERRAAGLCGSDPPVLSASASTRVGMKVKSRNPPRLLLLSLPSSPLPVVHLHTTMCHRFSSFSLLVRHVRLLLCNFCPQASRLTLMFTEHIYASTFIPLLCETKLIYHVINVISCYEYDLLSYLMLLT